MKGPTDDQRHTFGVDHFEHLVELRDKYSDFWLCTCGRGFKGENQAYQHYVVYHDQVPDDSQMVHLGIAWHKATKLPDDHTLRYGWLCSCGYCCESQEEMNTHLADCYRLASLNKENYRDQLKREQENTPIELTIRVRIWLKQKQVRWEIL